MIATCGAVGAPDDPPKTQELFKVGTVEVPHDVFALAIVKILRDQAQLFGRGKLDRPERLKLFCNQALEALKTVEETKETKKLASDITRTLKRAKRS